MSVRASVMVVKLPAEMNIANAADVRDDLLTAFESGAAVVVADMTGTTFTDTMAIRALVLTHMHAAAKGQRVAAGYLIAPGAARFVRDGIRRLLFHLSDRGGGSGRWNGHLTTRAR